MIELIGGTIIDIRKMTAEEADEEGWSLDHSIGSVIVLDNDHTIYASSDDEGNCMGTLFAENQKTKDKLYVTPIKCTEYFIKKKKLEMTDLKEGLQLTRKKCIMLMNAITAVKEYNTQYSDLWDEINEYQEKIVKQAKGADKNDST